MRRLVALVVTALAIGLLAPAGSAQATELGPHVKVAKVTKDVGRIGVLDKGDIIKFRFSSPVKLENYGDGFGFEIRGANGEGMRLENEAAPYGGYAVLSENDTLLTFRVNLIPEEYWPDDPARATLTYPLRLTPVYYTKIWYGICGRTECRPINETKGDFVINKR